MDLSWCIICDRHCIDNNLYCSESCRFQDSTSINKSSSPLLVTPPASPELTPFLYSLHDHRRRSANTGNMISNNNSATGYHYFPYKFTPGSPSESSLYADDT
ncbi:hypothetical protein G6F57_009548 [Rhizopus arrhizus]|uniref:Uncharacterized protein n=3 Tax=Rhizopus TaxID=4842 RepID=I1BGK9_RHIO9|nr:hypothetical protein RO3G_00043 [Rhizopus delemar RA 99-880]KAG0743265.1 hypothetical protein G6F23_006158 [Rhizopus arrhizus]KAG1050155.1 hypothetical protein G6F43_007549 [Rhizopus delemar]KAG0760579.1 hypothetical protein G6F24_008212 [Rhizopus arrhizus]KAG0786910.1 hypothetical protein G6F21_008265 [Rhizopus arrhizus]|eukprot:EIE75339.1 hypothetical protein RO3G_00043 [Rhizopus delemar RA 99-880]